MGDRQWQKLDGEPSLVESKGKTYQDIAEAISRASVTLQNIVDDASTTAQSMDATKALATSVKEDIDKALDRYQYAGDALVAYSTPLSTAIDDSEVAATKLADLHGDMYTAQQKQRSAQSQVDWMPRGAEDSEVQDAEQALSTADGRVESLQGEISTWEGKWQAAKDAKDSAARTAKDKIDEVVTGNKVNGLEDGWKDKLKHLAKTLYKVFKVICDVAGILAIFLSWVPVLGQVLVALAAVGAILSIIESAVKFAKGEIGFGQMLVGVGLGVVSLFGGKIATHLTKLTKLRTLSQSSQLISRVRASGEAGAKMYDDVARFGNGLPTTLAQKAKYAFKSPFVQSSSQTAVREAFQSGSLTKMQALKETLKGSFPTKFNLKGGVLGEASTLSDDLARIGFTNVTMQGPIRSAQAMSAVTWGSSAASSTYNAVNSAVSGDYAGAAKSTLGLGGSFAGGSWGSASGSPVTIWNDVKVLDSVDFPDPGQQWSYYSTN